MSNRYVWGRQTFQISKSEGESTRILSPIDPAIWGNTLTAIGTSNINSIDFDFSQGTQSTDGVITNPTITEELTHGSRLAMASAQAEYRQFVGIGGRRTAVVRISNLTNADWGYAVAGEDEISFSPYAVDVMVGAVIKTGDISTVSNSGASTYPPNDTRPRIASICVIPALLRRCNHVE